MRSASLELSKAQCERHRDKRQKKRERIDVLEELLKMWEAKGGDHHAYILGLRARLRNAKNQFNAMKI